MKILKLTTLLDFGGQEKQYISFTDRPELLKNEYVFASIGHGGYAEKVLKERGFKVKIFDLPVAHKHLKNIFILSSWIKEIKPDVVHTAAAEANFHGIIAAKLAGVKTIIGEEIGIPNHSSVAKQVFRWVYRFADQVIGVSQSVKDHLVNTGEIPESKGKVIYNPVSIPTPFPKKESPNFEIVYVGRLEIVKNVETLIKAFANSNHTHAHLTIVGDGRERHHLEALTSTLQMDSKITFTGFISEPSKYLSNADLFVLPSFSEGFGIAAAEAMFLKVPVLCSRVGGIPEFVKDGENGWLFNPKSTAELTVKLNQIIAMDAESLKMMGRKGYDKVINEFTVDKYIENLERFYHQLHHD